MVLVIAMVPPPRMFGGACQGMGESIQLLDWPALIQLVEWNDGICIIDVVRQGQHNRCWPCPKGGGLRRRLVLALRVSHTDFRGGGGACRWICP